MKPLLLKLFGLAIFVISFSACGDKEICYECTRESTAGTHNITNCSDRVQIKIWREEAEKKGYNCIEK